MNIKNFMICMIIFILSCSEQAVNDAGTDEPESKAVVGGVITLPASAAGRNYSVYMDADMDSSNGTVKSITGLCTGSTISYSFGEVNEGDYYIYCFVDADGSGGSPATGDYKGYFIISGAVSTFSVPPTGNALCNFDAYTITSMKATISGTIHLTVPITDREYGIIISANWDGTGGIAGTAGTVSGDIIHYALHDVDPGVYYVYCLVDTDKTTGPPNSGDFLGYYGSPDYNHPSAANVTVPASPEVIAVNFSTYIIPNSTKASVNGTISLPDSVSDVSYIVIVDNDNNPTTGTPFTIASADGNVTGNTIHYSISNLDEGTYYIYCLADINGNGSPGLNDYFGVYGGGNGNLNYNDYFPASVNVAAAGGTIITRNFQLFIMD